MNLTSIELAIREIIPHSGTLTKVMLWITSLGNWKFVIASALIVSTLCWLNRKRNLIIPFLLALAGTEISVELLKVIVHRARPIGGAFLEHSASFPSGHSAIAVALYGFIASLLWKRTKNRFGKSAILVTTLLIILLIGLSRIYLGVHFPTDVLGGYLVGTAWLLAAIRYSR